MFLKTFFKEDKEKCRHKKITSVARELVHVGQIPSERVKTDMEHDDVIEAVCKLSHGKVLQ